MQILLDYLCDVLASPLHHVEKGVQYKHRICVEVLLVQGDWLHCLVLSSVAKQGWLNDQNQIFD